MINKNGYLLTAAIFTLSFMTACSKNLMPPEGLDGTTLSSQTTQSGGSGGSGGKAGSGFNIGEQDSRSGSGFLTEESVGESARSGEFMTGGPNGSDDGSATSGGSAGRFQSEPFLGDNSNSGGSGFGSMGDQARTLPFKETDSLKDIYFKFDKYDLDDESRQILSQNASYLKANSSAAVEIQGHCDERGTNNYNIALGERRAQSTKMYLVSQGVSSRQIHTISYGEERPSCFDSNGACWLKNRRAHFRLSE
jgi:peptidoglycan-associated lipoprotein